MEGIVCRRRHFSISPEQLLLDLYRAYKDARKHKRGRKYQLEFEYNLESNLVALRDELFAGVYRPLPSTCFCLRRVLFGNVPHYRKYGRFSGDWLKFY